MTKIGVSPNITKLIKSQRRLFLLGAAISMKECLMSLFLSGGSK